MRKRKKSYTKADLNYLSRFMGALFPDQKRLGEIQAVYDNLTLLGQLLGAGTDITSMRQDFQELANVLLEQLAREHYKKATLNLSSCAHVAIDVLTRNLYERTADIGFLATDTLICSFAEAVEANPEFRLDPTQQYILQQHFSEYANKYSVYHNIILLSPAGDVLAQLDGNNFVERTSDRFLGDALTTLEPYVEVFRPVDLLPNESSPLMYVYRVMSNDGTRPVGLLCLCFRFQDECRRIFESLVAEDDWSVITLLDAKQQIIASSDPYQFPLGARLDTSAGDTCEIIRFAGREYLATTRHPRAYQGYAGPGWVGHAMAPLNHAFEVSDAPELATVAEDFLQDVLEVANLFPRELRDIPLRAETIQQALNRAVWNGNIWLARDSDTRNSGFAKILLREIGSTGARTRNVFSESTINLYKTVVSSVLFDCATQAALAIDIMDRNLYERANDCRWWALTPEFRAGFASGDLGSERRGRMTEILRRINGLYTVYNNLILFDANGRVIAVSNPAYNEFIGRSLPQEWVRNTLSLKDSQSYCISSFAETEHYAGQPTYVFSAAVRAPSPQGDPVGGIAIVFDATSQLRAMLADVLPRQEDNDLLPGAFAVFASRDGRIIASTDPAFAVGTQLDIGREFLSLARGESINAPVVFRERYYAVGSCMSAGYREYRADAQSNMDDVVALVFVPLSDRILDRNHPRRRYGETRIGRPPERGVDTLDLASFYIGSHWYGLHPVSVVAAVDADRLTPMPGSFDYVSGCLMYEDKAISIFDLSPFLNPVRPGVERRQPRRDGFSQRQILIIDSPQHQTRFGILVDSLGEIAEIAAHRIERVPGMMADGQSVVESLVKPAPEDNERRILIVLSPERIVQRIAGTLNAIEGGLR